MCLTVLLYGCPFQVPEAFQNLVDQVDDTLKHALEEEEKVPLSDVMNFNEVMLSLRLCILMLN